MALTWTPAGDGGWRITVGAGADPATAGLASLIAQAVHRARIAGVTGAHAGVRSVLVRFDGVAVNPDAVRAALAPVIAAAAADRRAATPGAIQRVAVCGCPACAPDGEWVAVRLGLPWPGALSRFCAAPFEVLAVGFLPGFPYLGPLPADFSLPRLDSPRLRVPAGSVGIGGPHAGIYPFESPGGWRLLGRIADRLFDPARDPAARFKAGDRIAFAPSFDHRAVHG